MLKFLGNLKSTPFYLLFGLMIAAGLTSCDSTDDVGPPQGVGNSQAATQGMNGNSANAAKPGDTTLVQIAIDSGFNELVTALTYVDDSLGTGLVALFNSNNAQNTIFAPTDSAFFALYDSLGVTSVTELPADAVQSVLLYHVTKGRRIARSVVPRAQYKTIQTLLLEKFRVDPEANIEAIGSTASIIQPDISASNGIIHVIDGVLWPFE